LRAHISISIQRAASKKWQHDGQAVNTIFGKTSITLFCVLLVLEAPHGIIGEANLMSGAP
jgi:hypothetical protein